MTSHLITSALEDLYTNEGFPEEVLNFNVEQDVGVCLNCGVFDVKHGTVLKLGEDKEVLETLHGYTKLTAYEISKLYSSLRVDNQTYF